MGIEKTIFARRIYRSRAHIKIDNLSKFDDRSPERQNGQCIPASFIAQESCYLKQSPLQTIWNCNLLHKLNVGYYT